MEAVTVLATAPAILALVNLAKRFGLSGAWCALLAVILGVVLSVADALLAGRPVLPASAAGLLLGLGAAGLYDVAATIGGDTYTPERATEDVDAA